MNDVPSDRTEQRRQALRRGIARTTRAQLAARGAKRETVERRIDERIDAAGASDGVRKLRCAECGAGFTARRSDARFCGDVCRKRSRRREVREGG